MGQIIDKSVITSIEIEPLNTHLFAHDYIYMPCTCRYQSGFPIRALEMNA